MLLTITFFLDSAFFSQSSLSPSKDLPGFRKILPRASYFVLSKGCSSDQQSGASQSELSVESVDSPAEGGAPSASLIQEARLASLGMAGEVELSEPPIVVEEIAEETAAVSPALQRIPPFSSSSISPKAAVPADSSVPQGSADYIANGVPLRGIEARAGTTSYSATMVQQTQGQTTQVVAIIPTQVRPKFPSASAR